MSDNTKTTSVKIARQFLKVRDPGHRRGMVIKYVAIIVVFAVLNSLSHRWDSPLSMMPETATAIFMGYFVLLAICVMKFPLEAQFINWEAVEEAAQDKGRPVDKRKTTAP